MSSGFAYEVQCECGGTFFLEKAKADVAFEQVTAHNMVDGHYGFVCVVCPHCKAKASLSPMETGQ